jgi:hypothetical protein
MESLLIMIAFSFFFSDLIDFLSAGDPPVYIGFGSIVIADPIKV